MNADLPSFVKAVKEYFEIPGNKAVTEFKELSTQDKIELSAMLQDKIPHVPYTPPVSSLQN
jgi:hypothetical protein